MAMSNLETTESSKASVKVYPTPASSRGSWKTSATNPGNVGAATTKQSHTGAK